MIKKHTNHNAVLTVGTIICENKDLFCSASSFNDDFLNLVCSLGDGGLNNKEYSHHAWITLDTMEVIDFTYAASFQIANPKTDTCTPFNFNYLFKHPDNFTDAMYYKPMLVGDAFYRKFDNLRYMLGKMMSENIWR